MSRFATYRWSCNLTAFKKTPQKEKVSNNFSSKINSSQSYTKSICSKSVHRKSVHTKSLQKGLYSPYTDSRGVYSRGLYPPTYAFSTQANMPKNCILKKDSTTVELPRDTNQARGIAEYAIDFISGSLSGWPKSNPHFEKAVERVKDFHTDSVLCAISAIALQTRAPSVLREEALEYTHEKGAFLFGGSPPLHVEKAIAANCAATREWDSNGTVFGYCEDSSSRQAGEYGHNDFYPVVVAAAQINRKLTGRDVVLGMLCLDEIRGRLCEVFSLKTYKLDHVVHGAIASAAVYGALQGCTIDQIESAIGMSVAHFIPFRAIRAGHQLSDSKGASAALSTEVAVLSVLRSIRGFEGPRDIFRNPEAIFRWNEKQADGQSPFSLTFNHTASETSNFSVMGMHFKLGVYEHQSAGALQGLLNIMIQNPAILEDLESIEEIIVFSYEHALHIIGDPAKKTPTTRQSADHSMLYILSSLLLKASKLKELPKEHDAAWCAVMLSPEDYSQEAINNPLTRKLMSIISFQHGGREFDARYPRGIPTAVEIRTPAGVFKSGLIEYPAGHARNTSADLKKILSRKFEMMGAIALEKKECEKLVDRLSKIENMSNDELRSIYDMKMVPVKPSIDKC